MDLAPYAGAIKSVVYLGIVILVTIGVRKMSSGLRVEKRILKSQLKGHNEAHKAGEEFKAAGGLGGAIDNGLPDDPSK